MRSSVRPLASCLSAVALSAMLGLATANAATSDADATETPPPVTTTTPAAEFKVTVPTIETDGSNISDSVLRAIFEGDFTRAGELATLTARQIRIPEVRLHTVIAGGGTGTGSSETVYRDIVLNNVVNGVAESSAVGSTDLVGDKDVSFHFGKMSSGLLDIAGLLQFYRLIPVADTSERKPLYKDIMLAGGSMTGPKFSCAIGAITLAEFKGRPLKMSFSDLMTMAKKVQAEGKDASPESVAQLVSFYADFFDAFESSPMVSSGFDCSGTSDKGPVKVAAGSLTVGAFAPGHYPEIAMGNMAVEVGEDGTFSLGNLRLKGFDYTGPLKVLQAANGHFDQEWATQHYRELIPAFEGWALADLKVNFPDEENGGRIDASVGAFDLTLGSYVNGIPTDISSSASHVAFTIPDNTENENLRQLKGFGFDRLDVGYDLAAKWDKDAGAIKVDKLAVNGVDLGSVSLAALLGNAGESLFATDPQAAMEAAYGLTLKQVQVAVEDAGLREKAIEIGARMIDQEPAKYQSMLSGQARGSLLSLLGSTPEVEALSDAIGTFLDHGGALSILFKVKDAAGIDFDTLQQLMANPAAITDLIAIEASAKAPQ